MDFLTRLLILSKALIKGCPIKLKSATIIETVVSLTILLSIMTLFFVQIDRINASVNPEAVYKAHLITNRLFNSEDILITDEPEMEISGYLVHKTISILSQGLYVIRLDVIDHRGKLLYSRKRIMSDDIDL